MRAAHSDELRKFFSTSGSPIWPAFCRSVRRSPGTAASIVSDAADDDVRGAHAARPSRLYAPPAASAAVFVQHASPSYTATVHSESERQSAQHCSLLSAARFLPLSVPFAGL